MTEEDRKTLIPLDRLDVPALPDVLRTILREVLFTARQHQEIHGMAKAVRTGLEQWMVVVANRSDMQDLISMYVRAVALAWPELFVVAYDRNVFGSYRLDDAEYEVLKSSREDLRAKVEAEEKAFHENIKKKGNIAPQRDRVRTLKA